MGNNPVSPSPSPEQQIRVASGDLTVQLMPTSIKIYFLTEERLEIVSSLAVGNAVYLGILGISVGLVVSFGIVLKTVTLNAADTALFGALALASGFSTVICGLMFGVGFRRSRRSLDQIKQSPIIKQLSQ